MMDGVDILGDGDRSNAYQGNEYPYSILPFPFLPQISFNLNATKRTIYVIWLAKSALRAYHLIKSSLIMVSRPRVLCPGCPCGCNLKKWHFYLTLYSRWCQHRKARLQLKSSPDYADIMIKTIRL